MIIFYSELIMKKIAIMALASLLLASCDKCDTPILIPETNFQTTVDGKSVDLYTLRSGDITMQVTNFGARVVALWTPDREGKYDDIVLGYNHIDRYVNNSGERFLGAVVGPYANRIANGTYSIGEEAYHFPQNNNGQTLHGGLKGLDMVVWDVKEVTENSIVFFYLRPHGQDGMPGNLAITMTYTLTPENEFKVDYKATTDQSTHVNISHHSFFNLKGEGNGTIEDLVMVINASAITPVNEVLIPSGEIADVTGTPFDFRMPHTIGERINAENEQLTFGRGYDHNWVIDRAGDGVVFAAMVYEAQSGRMMSVYTDQPGMQFYSGNFFDGSSKGKYNKALRFRESIALETQKFPDTPHHDHFPSTLLNPGETYTHVCIYKFEVK